MDQREFDRRFEYLDECVIGGLEFLARKLEAGEFPELKLGNFKRPLVVGSGNALATGRILYQDYDAVFADESTYEDKMSKIKTIDGIAIVSATGGKDAVKIAQRLKELKIDKEIRLITCNKNAEARPFVSSVIPFPKRPEPYTYNTSTYLAMVLGKTRENPREILGFINNEAKSNLPSDLNRYNAFYFIVPAEFDIVREIYLTKFDEIFGGKPIKGRAFTFGQTRHAKNVVRSNEELFINLGETNPDLPKLMRPGRGYRRLDFPIPSNADFGAMIALGYYIIGKIQRVNPQWFRESVLEYCGHISESFGQNIELIVK